MSFQKHVLRAAKHKTPVVRGASTVLLAAGSFKQVCMCIGAKMLRQAVGHLYILWDTGLIEYAQCTKKEQQLWQLLYLTNMLSCSDQLAHESLVRVTSTTNMAAAATTAVVAPLSLDACTAAIQTCSPIQNHDAEAESKKRTDDKSTARASVTTEHLPTTRCNALYD